MVNTFTFTMGSGSGSPPERRHTSLNPTSPTEPHQAAVLLPIAKPDQIASFRNLGNPNVPCGTIARTDRTDLLPIELRVANTDSRAYRGTPGYPRYGVAPGVGTEPKTRLLNRTIGHYNTSCGLDRYATRSKHCKLHENRPVGCIHPIVHFARWIGTTCDRRPVV